LLVFKF